MASCSVFVKRLFFKSVFPFQPEFDFLLKQVWADNADYCSIQYAGTGALKTDFTRTGKRTKWGMLKDGYNSAIRYYKNNFTDGFRQVSFIITFKFWQIKFLL